MQHVIPHKIGPTDLHRHISKLSRYIWYNFPQCPSSQNNISETNITSASTTSTYATQMLIIWNIIIIRVYSTYIQLFKIIYYAKLYNFYRLQELLFQKLRYVYYMLQNTTLAKFEIANHKHSCKHFLLNICDCPMMATVTSRNK
jgi:hypothetical protein